MKCKKCEKVETNKQIEKLMKGIVSLMKDEIKVSMLEVLRDLEARGVVIFLENKKVEGMKN